MFIESDHPMFLEIKNLGTISSSRLEFLSYLYRFQPCTNNELIKKIQKERPDLDANELMAFNKLSSDLKDNGTVHIVEMRPCFETGRLSQVLAPTFRLPCPKGMRLFADSYIVEKTEIKTDLSTVVFGGHSEHVQDFAIKFCHHKVPAAIKRFQNEVEMMLKLQNHPEVVTILEYNLNHHPPYYVMPRARGGNLETLIPRLKGDFVFQKLVFNRLIDCIHKLHNEKILHRDIKPQNFLVYSDEDIKVIDFGISRKPKEDTTTRVTVTGIPGGTEQFAPPEYIDPTGFKEADFTWDTYSLTATLYNLMTGRNARFLVNHGDIPEPLFDVLRKGTSILQKDRYQSVNELRSELNQAFEKFDDPTIMKIGLEIKTSKSQNPQNSLSTAPSPSQ